MQLKGTKTEKNLRAALMGESVARNKYTYFAEQARKEGKDEVADFFETLARNEMEHARLWYKLLYGELGETVENLQIAADGEHAEWTDMYVRFAKEAKEEGFDEIANLFTQVKRIERNHEREELKLINKLKNGEVEANEAEVEDSWICGHCGFMGKKVDELDTCPICHREIIHL